MTLAISEARWREAQHGERAFWNGGDRRALAGELHALYARELGLDRVAVAGKSVLDLGAGPYPIGAALKLPLSSYVCVDPLEWPDVDGAARVIGQAEEYSGPEADEVWGYNVLQHVQDPTAVMETAKRHALTTVRWFDWIDTPLADHHPHRIGADWLLSAFSGWRATRYRRGMSHGQHYVAIVAERPT